MKNLANRLSETDEYRTGTRTFTCTPSSRRGFVRVSEIDPRYFEFSNGDFFWPAGLNVCAAYDVRNIELLGVLVNQYEGTKAFERYLEGMGKNHATFARIWMSCWSLAIEWSDRYHHEYESLGDYSMKNAWRLDRVMELAEKNGVYVQLTLDTFGHFRSNPNRNRRDRHQDWTGNAYNFMAGGILSHPWYFFLDENAFDYYAKRLRYISSRWGYSPALFGWEIFNEIDLITYPPGNFGLNRADFDRRMVKWHRDTANVLHDTDAHGHPVTTNYASYVKDYNVWKLREMDYITTNRYVNDLPRLTGWIFEDKVQVIEKPTGLVRPHYILESGSDWRGKDLQNTEDYLHISLWASWMFPNAASGMAWWWVVIDQENFYTHFDAFHRFAEGEDRRGHNWRYRQFPEYLECKCPKKHQIGRRGKPDSGPHLWGDYTPLPDTVVFADPEKAAGNLLELLYLHDNTTAYVWVYDRAYYGIDTHIHPNKSNDGVIISLLSLEKGHYTVEAWDTWKGEIVTTDILEKSDTPLQVHLPPFQKDMALKIKLTSPPDDDYLEN